MLDAQHDPGPAGANQRAPEATAASALRIGGAEIRVGTASWTDRTMTARGVFYPDKVSTPEARLRYYASRFSMVEADVGFYAIPDRAMTERWVERTPADFVFDVKAHALMTGHATDIARLPGSIREAITSSGFTGSRRQGSADRGPRRGLATLSRRDGTAPRDEEARSGDAAVRAVDSPDQAHARNACSGSRAAR